MLSVLLLTLLATGVGVARAQTASIGSVENTIGTLIVRRADGRVDEVRGKGSLPLYEGDECHTEKASKALIKLSDGTQVAMNAETKFRYQTRQERTKGTTKIFKLLLGELWMRTVGPSQIEVETPVATAAIKGTEFNIKVDGEGKSTLTVIEGVVEFGTPFGTCPIPKSTQSFGERGKRCTKPVPVDPAPVTAWIADVAR
jgi:ferric-dicitrate binding protein FerR (iron transport regulator)